MAVNILPVLARFLLSRQTPHKAETVHVLDLIIPVFVVFSFQYYNYLRTYKCLNRKSRGVGGRFSLKMKQSFFFFWKGKREDERDSKRKGGGFVRMDGRGGGGGGGGNALVRCNEGLFYTQWTVI